MKVYLGRHVFGLAAILFGIIDLFLVWLPAPFADPHKLINWAGNAQNLAITGAAWIVADYLLQNRDRRSSLGSPEAQAAQA
jgi:hypothetical protein